MTKISGQNGISASEPDLSAIEQETAMAHVDEDPLAAHQRDFTGK